MPLTGVSAAPGAMRRAAAIAAALAPAAVAPPPSAGEAAALFTKFKADFSRSYADKAEEDRRFANFQLVLAKIAREQDAGNDAHGITRFADLSEQEFADTYLRAPGKYGEKEEKDEEPVMWDGERCESCVRFPEMANYSFAAGLDWSTKGAVVRVKDQGQCDSCFAFGATADMEGTWFLAGNKLISLSEQEMLSCASGGTKHGCGGGSRKKMFNWVSQKGGVVSESSYPYHSGGGVAPQCQKTKEQPVAAKILSWTQVSKDAAGEAGMVDAVTKLGPVSIGISAMHMQTYFGGVDKPSFCAQKHDHAPAIVGYGTANGVDYWKIKNSWGSYWGENGYYRVVRGRNACGLATDAEHTSTRAAYHCDPHTHTCNLGGHGHSTMEKCQKACSAPTPPPGVPTPAPAPAVRWHCVNKTLTCVKHVPPAKGHSTEQGCLKSCRLPEPTLPPIGERYQCIQSNKTCLKSPHGGSLEMCQAACNPTPEPAPPAAASYQCNQVTSTCEKSGSGGYPKDLCELMCS